MNVCVKLLEELRKLVRTMGEKYKDVEELVLLDTYLDMLEGCIKASGEVFEMLDNLNETLTAIHKETLQKLTKLYRETN